MKRINEKKSDFVYMPYIIKASNDVNGVNEWRKQMCLQKQQVKQILLSKNLAVN